MNLQFPTMRTFEKKQYFLACWRMTVAETKRDAEFAMRVYDFTGSQLHTAQRIDSMPLNETQTYPLTNTDGVFLYKENVDI